MTQQKLIAAELSESEERGRLLLELTSEALLLMDRGIIFDLNSAMVKMFGYSRAELIGNTWAKMVHPDDHQRIPAGNR